MSEPKAPKVIDVEFIETREQPQGSQLEADVVRFVRRGERVKNAVGAAFDSVVDFFDGIPIEKRDLPPR